MAIKDASYWELVEELYQVEPKLETNPNWVRATDVPFTEVFTMRCYALDA